MELSPLISVLSVPLAAMVFLLARAPVRQTSGIAAALNLVLTLGLVWRYPDAHGGYAEELNLPWCRLPGLPEIHFHLGLNGLNLPLLFLTTLITLISIAVTSEDLPRLREHCLLLLSLSFCALGASLSLDLFFLLLFQGAALVPLFLLIGIWGGQNRQFAAFQGTLFGAAGLLLLLAGAAAWESSLPAQARTLDLTQLQVWASHHPLTHYSTSGWLILLGGGILAGFFPFHSWMAGSLSSAPTSAAVFQTAVLQKIALYTLLRLSLPFFSHEQEWSVFLLVWLCAHLLYCGYVTLAQKELPSLIAYGSITQQGALLFGWSCGNRLGLDGALFFFVAQGMASALLFGLSGEIIRRAGEDRLAELHGLARTMPKLHLLFLFGTAAFLGLPGLALFPAQLQLILGGVTAFLPISTVMTLFGLFLVTPALLRGWRQIFFSPGPESQGPDLVPLGDGAPYLLLIFFSLLLGLFPSLLARLLEPSVNLFFSAS